MKRWTVTVAAVCVAAGLSLTQAQTPAAQTPGHPVTGAGQPTDTKAQPAKTDMHSSGKRR